MTTEFEIDPYQGFAAIAIKIKKPGYIFVSMKRKGTRAIIIWKEKNDE